MDSTLRQATRSIDGLRQILCARYETQRIYRRCSREAAPSAVPTWQIKEDLFATDADRKRKRLDHSHDDVNGVPIQAVWQIHIFPSIQLVARNVEFAAHGASFSGASEPSVAVAWLPVQVYASLCHLPLGEELGSFLMARGPGSGPWGPKSRKSRRGRIKP